MTIKSILDVDTGTLTIAQLMKGYVQFISAERGLMLFMVTVGSAFLASTTLNWPSAIYLGLITFCIWSSADAIDNICDVDLDVYSDPFRAKFTRRIGKTGLYIAIAFTILSLALGAATLMPYVFLFTALGVGLGIIYSVPPFRLRRTPFKFIVNSSVGFVPVLIVAAFYNFPSLNIISLIVLMGITISVYSLWEDLADFRSDLEGGSRTLPIIMGFKRGLVLTIALGYVIIGLMTFVGFMFGLPWFYFVVIAGIITYISARILQKRNLIVKEVKDKDTLYKLGESLAKDFVLIAAVFTVTLMISGLVTLIHP